MPDDTTDLPAFTLEDLREAEALADDIRRLVGIFVASATEDVGVDHDAREREWQRLADAGEPFTIDGPRRAQGHEAIDRLRAARAALRGDPTDIVTLERNLLLAVESAARHTVEEGRGFLDRAARGQWEWLLRASPRAAAAWTEPRAFELFREAVRVDGARQKKLEVLHKLMCMGFSDEVPEHAGAWEKRLQRSGSLVSRKPHP